MCTLVGWALLHPFSAAAFEEFTWQPRGTWEGYLIRRLEAPCTKYYMVSTHWVRDWAHDICISGRTRFHGYLEWIGKAGRDGYEARYLQPCAKRGVMEVCFFDSLRNGPLLRTGRSDGYCNNQVISEAEWHFLPFQLWWRLCEVNRMDRNPKPSSDILHLLGYAGA